MAYSGTLIIETVRNNEKKQKSITDINPTASNANLKTLAQGITALTTSSYINAYKVLKQSVDDSDT